MERRASGVGDTSSSRGNTMVCIPSALALSSTYAFGLLQIMVFTRAISVLLKCSIIFCALLPFPEANIAIFFIGLCVYLCKINQNLIFLLPLCFVVGENN